MTRGLAELDWEDATEYAPAVITAIAMPLTFSIAHGIGIGFMTYAVVKIVSGKWRECPPAVLVIGVLFALTAHVDDWPVARGGSSAIPSALASYLASLGGRIETGRPIVSLADLPESRVVLFDTSPAQLSAIAARELPDGYRRRLGRYRYGPGVFKLDWALDGSIPWRDPRCLEASTVHVGGTLEEICASERDMYRGRHSERPYLIVCQQSEFDDTHAPEGKHTGYAY